MMEVIDECRNCTVRGDLSACALTKCSKHHTWYADQLRAEVERLKAERERIAYLHAAMCTPDLHFESCRDMRREMNMLLHGRDCLPDWVWDAPTTEGEEG